MSKLFFIINEKSTGPGADYNDLKKYIKIEYQQLYFNSTKDMHPQVIDSHEIVPCNLTLNKKESNWKKF